MLELIGKVANSWTDRIDANAEEIFVAMYAMSPTIGTNRRTTTKEVEEWEMFSVAAFEYDARHGTSTSRSSWSLQRMHHTCITQLTTSSQQQQQQHHDKKGEVLAVTSSSPG
jgi:hypothetical protein